MALHYITLFSYIRLITDLKARNKTQKGRRACQLFSLQKDTEGLIYFRYDRHLKTATQKNVHRFYLQGIAQKLKSL